MSDQFENRIKQLEEALAVTKGRVDGIHVVLLTIARHLPPSMAQECERQLLQAAEKVAADLLALPLPDAVGDELLRVVHQGAEVLGHAAKK